MIYKKYLQSVANVYNANNLLKFGFIVLLIMQIGNWHQQKNYLDEQKTILSPIGHTNGLWVSNNNASDEYLMFMTNYVMGLLGNHNAYTVKEQYSKLVKLHAPEKVGEARRKLDQLSSEVTKYATSGSTLTYLNTDVSIDREKKIIKIKCVNDRFLNGVKSGTTRKEYYIFYKIGLARFWLLDIKEGKKIA